MVLITPEIMTIDGFRTRLGFGYLDGKNSSLFARLTSGFFLKKWKTTVSHSALRKISGLRERNVFVGSSRRFFRMDINGHFFIVPSKVKVYEEIYATGADYFPKEVVLHHKSIEREIRSWMNKIQEHKDILQNVFNDILVGIDFYSSQLKSLSEGKNPATTAEWYVNFNTIKMGSKSVSQLKEKAPKTHSLVKKIEDNLLCLLSQMEVICSKSDKNYFHVHDSYVKRDNELEELISKLQSANSENIPLSQTILKTSELLVLYIGIFQQIVIDNAYRKKPEFWPSQVINLSEGGVAVFIKKRFLKFDVVDFLFAPDTKTKPIEFKGKVVNVHPIPGEYVERVSIQFEFPSEDEKSRVRKLINKKELDDFLTYVKSK